MIPVVAVVGPTASGKTSLALALAERFPAEIVSSDSALIYRGADVGTAKPTAEERARVPHHLLDLRELDQSFSLAEFQSLAGQAVRDIHARGRLPLVVGGTGLYVRGLLQGYELPEAPPDPDLRLRLNATPLPELVEQLLRLDPAAERLDLKNPRRVARALEVCLTTGQPFSALQRKRDSGLRSLLLGIRWSREELHRRIAARTRQMVQEGFVEEVRDLAEKGYGPHLRRLKLIGYAEVLDVVEGRLSLVEALDRIELVTRQYARRQMTWFRREREIVWLEAPGDLLPEAGHHVERFLGEGEETDKC
ncbi:MAG: tRNA (adenosine(37)-N6)-dimethylallyltransferase MiaA [Candidatus Eremiobacterota bacterium]